MAQRPGSPFGPDLVPVNDAGTALDTKKDYNRAGYTLTAGHDYYYDLNPAAKESPYQSVQVKWDNALAGTVTIEDSNFVDVNLWSSTAGDWQVENPSTAYVPVVGGTLSNATVTISGTTAGGCLFNVGQIGSMRARLHIHCTTGGVARVAANCKD